MRLEAMRLEYVLGDWAANLGVGALVGVLLAVEVGQGWSMLVAMLAGMLQGMGIAMALATFGGILLGAFELMLPLMLTGMLAGMAVAMAAAMQPFSPTQGALWGLAAGAVSMTYSTLLDWRLKGDARVEP